MDTEDYTGFLIISGLKRDNVWQAHWRVVSLPDKDDTGFLMISGLKRSRGSQMPDLMRITRQLGQLEKLAELVKDERVG